MRIAGQSIIKMDVPTLSKSAFLNFLITLDLPNSEQGMIGLRALETLRLTPRNWPRNLTFYVEGLEAKSALPPLEETTAAGPHHVDAAQGALPQVRAPPQAPNLPNLHIRWKVYTVSKKDRRVSVHAAQNRHRADSPNYGQAAAVPLSHHLERRPVRPVQPKHCHVLIGTGGRAQPEGFARDGDPAHPDATLDQVQAAASPQSLQPHWLLTHPAPSTRMSCVVQKVCISKTDMFQLKPLFHEVLKTTLGADQEQTYYLYSEVVELVSEYILANPQLVDPRHIKLANVEDDPLGAGLGVKAFHRWQVPSLIKNQLESSCFPLGSAPSPPSTSSSTPTLSRTAWFASKRKVAVLDEVLTVSGDPAQGSAPPARGIAEGRGSSMSAQSRNPSWEVMTTHLQLTLAQWSVWSSKLTCA
jgi:hypothetical protein